MIARLNWWCDYLGLGPHGSLVYWITIDDNGQFYLFSGLELSPASISSGV